MVKSIEFSPLENVMIAAILETEHSSSAEGNITISFREFTRSVYNVQGDTLNQKIRELCNITTKELAHFVYNRVVTKMEVNSDTFEPDDDILLKL